jgi:hypothetical protein
VERRGTQTSNWRTIFVEMEAGFVDKTLKLHHFENESRKDRLNYDYQDVMRWRITA